MKYKVGDRVKIVDRETMINIYDDDSIIQSLEKYSGTIMTIIKISSLFDGTECYKMNEDNELFSWNDDDIECLVTSDIESSTGHLMVNEKGLYTINW